MATKLVVVWTVESEKERDLGDHVVVVVVPQCTRQLLIVHRRLVLALAPHLRDRLGAVQFELSVGRHPLNNLTVMPVSQQLQQELPQLDLTVVACTSCKTVLGNFQLIILPANDRLPLATNTRFTGARDDGVAVASAGPYADHLH